ncbi:hypothetical protein HPB50_021594 [Hyalomma asiaticum]|uniref:Uncharacterized protein n=1 Tax=Hyalomma asiaticum TaxID=266040 RepID=A0ACB7TNS7_HYAAI|nr:hypothetical protein HPB50_021594 [Hyalomma asiaticum]
MLMNIRQVRRRRFTRSENTYEAGSSSSVPFSWNSLIRESLLQTSWPISLSADSDDDEFDLFNPRSFSVSIFSVVFLIACCRINGRTQCLLARKPAAVRLGAISRQLGEGQRNR